MGMIPTINHTQALGHVADQYAEWASELNDPLAFVRQHAVANSLDIEPRPLGFGRMVLDGDIVTSDPEKRYVALAIIYYSVVPNFHSHLFDWSSYVAAGALSHVVVDIDLPSKPRSKTNDTDLQAWRNWVDENGSTQIAPAADIGWIEQPLPTKTEELTVGDRFGLGASTIHAVTAADPNTLTIHVREVARPLPENKAKKALFFASEGNAS